MSLTEEEDKEFWSLMRSDEASLKVSTAIKRMKHGGHHGGGHDNVSLSSGGWSSGQEDMISPRGDSGMHLFLQFLLTDTKTFFLEFSISRNF